MHMGVCSHMGERRDVCRGVCWWEGSGTSHRHRPFSPEPKTGFRLACPWLSWLERQDPGTGGGRWRVCQRGLGRGSSCARAKKHHHGPGWGRSAKRGPDASNSQLGPRVPAPRLGGGSAYLYHGGWVLKAWSHGWQGPAAGHSSGAPSGSGPRAHLACSSNCHSEEDLKGEGSGRAGRPRAPGRFKGARRLGRRQLRGP